MPYLTTVERAGIEKGLRQGLKRGKQIGHREGEADLLLWLIAEKFGADAADRARARIAAADSASLRPLVQAHPERRHGGRDFRLAQSHEPAGPG
jgi:hypothetical protein